MDVTEEEYYADVPESSSDEDSQDSDGYVVPPPPEQKTLPATPSSKPSIITSAKDIASAIKFKLNNNTMESDITRPKTSVSAGKTVSSRPSSSLVSERPGMSPPPPPPHVSGRKSPSRPDPPPASAKMVALKPKVLPSSGRLSPARPDPHL